MIEIAIGIVASVTGGFALFLLQRYFKNKERQDELRDSKKARENILIIKSIDAIGDLTEANSIALRDGKTNGEMHEAMDHYGSIKKEMYEYLLEQNSKK